jgi:hypothetical protein
MLSRLHRAACLAACLACTGCCGGLDCGGADCGPKWWSVGPYAYMKYDCACETCGPGGCNGCGGEGCTCGGKVACGDQCTGAPGCGCGACGGAIGAGECPNACGGCCCCRPNGKCWVLGAVCGCSGCGDLYWNEWYNDPPQCYEPCDCYGNYVGPGHAGGYYRAPYRRHEVPFAGGYAAGQESNIPPLEAADAPPLEVEAAPLDDAPVEGADDAGPAMGDGVDAAAYEEAELSVPLQYPN